MVGVAQLAERWLVEPEVAGSSPVVHPRRKRSEQVTGRFPFSPGAHVTRAESDVELDELLSLDMPWVTIVWDDPVNLQQYVTHVFMMYFGFARPEAERLMLLVHNEGRAVVATGPREEMERHVEAMHDVGLWATVAKAFE